jgi:dATP/dGTP diphosphohydrolase, N-terminal
MKTEVFIRMSEKTTNHNDPRMLGIGGAPTRATTLPTEAGDRKKYPIASGLMDYFPDALVAVSHISYRGNEQHNPGQPLHWSRGKSTDEADTMLRHFMQRGTIDTDGVRHSAKMVWRALAFLQKEIEAEQAGDK